MYADRKEDLPPRLRALEEDLRARGLGYHYHTELDLPAQARIWSLREAALGLSMAMKDDAKSISFVEDTAVAPEKLSDFIDRFLKIVDDHGTTAGVYAHASVGCLHVRPVMNLKTEEGVRKFESIANAVANLVLEYGGALSGEHGDGLVRGPFMRQMFGDALYEAFREIKRTFDPLGIFNPGKIVDSPPMTSNLRFGGGYKTANPTTWFDYSEYGGLGGAVEMCSGVGACRKKLSGTMCPSYMATREESDSTRGRANVLRLGHVGTARRIGPRRRRRVSGARSVPGVPGVQGRMPGRRRHGAVQERIPGRLLEPPRHSEQGARPGQRSPAVGVGQPIRAGVELDRRQRSRTLDEREGAGPGCPARASTVEARDLRAVAGAPSAAA